MSRNVNIINNPSVTLSSSGGIVAGTVATSGVVGLSASMGDGYNKIALINCTGITVISSGACKMAGYTCLNQNGSAAFLQCFDVNQATAVVPGVTAPDFVLPMPCVSQVNGVFGILCNLEVPVGIQCFNGLKVYPAFTANGSGFITTGLNGTVFYR